MIAEITAYPEKISSSIEHYRFREALSELMNLARLGNKYLGDMEPWKLIKTDEKRVQTIMNLSLQIAANLSILMEPFLPFTAKKLKEMLHLKKDLKWKDAKSSNLLEAGHQLNEAGLLFEKIEDEAITLQIKKLEDSKALNAANKETVIEPAKAETSIISTKWIFV